MVGICTMKPIILDTAHLPCGREYQQKSFRLHGYKIGNAKHYPSDEGVPLEHHC